MGYVFGVVGDCRGSGAILFLENKKACSINKWQVATLQFVLYMVYL